ncbi:MAG: CDP-alcohol phosphatidyltransferase family protein [Candidatus Portiera sp.]|nr:CDP-alcohol phosphatidyltransferase family protein [Portiera sp.]
MLDSGFRKLVTPLLDLAGRLSMSIPVNANQITWIGFVLGLIGCVAIGLQFYLIGLVFVLANRVADVIDGAVARKKGITDYGGYLDIVLDFFFYSAVPCAFAISNPEFGVPAAVLILSFMGTASSFLAYAIICAKRGISTEERGRKSFYYLGGLMESTETVIFFVLFCLMPQYFPILAYILACLCFVTFGVRIYAAYEKFAA